MAEAIVAGGQRDQLSLTVLYDERCPLCRRLRRWQGEQPTLRSISFVAASSAAVRIPAVRSPTFSSSDWICGAGVLIAPTLPST